MRNTILSIRGLFAALILTLILGQAAPGVPALAAPNGDVYLPFIGNRYNPAAASRAVNAPYIDSSDILGQHLAETAVLWFGQLTPDRSSTDVRVAYNNTELVIYTTTYDRIITYNTSATPGDLTQWDTAALAIQTDSAANAKPGANAYRYMVSARQYEALTDPRYRATYRGNGSGWSVQSLSFLYNFGSMGSGVGDSGEDKGWAVTFRIPFSSLGISKPANGTIWRMHLEVYNRNSQSGPSLGSQTWPENGDANSPSSWGQLRFGMPVYTPPAAKNPQTLTVRRGLAGSTVIDAGVGGGADCGGAAAPGNYYPTWGSLNYSGRTDMNVQNQGLIADWPCFSRVYLTFSLPAIPNGKIVRSARLVLAHMGGSEPSQAVPSYIQFLSLSEDWSEATVNWNNGPLARENLGGAWVPVYTPDWSDPNPWSKIPKREWDVSLAVIDAYNRGTPLRLAMYSADHGTTDGMHTGKYFVSSDSEDWNAANRPTLLIEVVDP